MRSQSARGEESGRWVSTSCNGCFSACAIQVYQEDGRICAAKGHPEVLSSRGKVCGKSLARIADLYDPNRVTTPLKRTNPEKGLGVDPKWQEISWEEALETVVERLDAVRRDDPRKLVLATFDLCNMGATIAFAEAFGTPNYDFYNATYCGGGLHTTFFNTFGTINSEADLEHCDHIILWGAQLGLGANNNPIRAIANMADARRRGVKLVVIDPILGHAAAKADEWVPIRPGTDGALALSMLNVLLNELGIYDEAFLRRRTNGTYLVGADGHYVRDTDSGRPLVWDARAEAPVPFDQAESGSAALEGSYRAGEGECRPALALLKEHVRRYPPERAAEITGVPASTIRRIAQEHGEAARIGATIEIDGRSLPLRPAAVDFKRGVNAHKNSLFNCFSLQLLNIVLGAMDVPGGLLGSNAIGPYGYWRASAAKDGLIATDVFKIGRSAAFQSSYPVREVRAPDTLNLEGLFPVSGFLPSLPHYSMRDPERFRLPYRPSALVMCRTNLMMSYHDPKAIAEWLGSLDFVLGFARQIDETTEFADIVLPEAHDFERYWLFPANQPAGFITPGPGDWYGQVVQPVVDPPEGVRNWLDVLLEMGERLGIVAGMNDTLNRFTGLELMEDLKLQPDRRYEIEEICWKEVGMYARLAGREDTQDLFRDTPALHFYEKTLEESYPGIALEARIPVYLEHFIDAGEQVEKVTRELDMGWWDTSRYRSLPDWHPCPAHEDDSGEYDLLLANTKGALLSHTINAENPWVDDICSRNRNDYRVLLHTRAAAERGIRDGDLVYVESRTGRVKGRVRVTEGVHPEVLGTVGILGHWARQKPISRGQGVHSNALIATDWNMVDPLSGQIDTCARVKVYRAED